MKQIKEFLLKNGFKIEDVLETRFKNDNCLIEFLLDNKSSSYSITGKFLDFTGTMFSTDLNIYWLVGVLTWYKLIDKNYIQ